YLISEAMFHLGVPTTRALSLVSTGEEVVRDMFYNGNAKPEPGAIVSRLAPNFLRFGTFEILTARDETENLRNLTEWTIGKYFPHLTGKDKILHWYREIVERTADLMVEWQRVGFVHGVMNTDNMSVMGLTIDYGPFSFLDQYDLNFTPNTTDLPGRRYAFGNQASVAYWNLGRMASAILPLFDKPEPLEQALAEYEKIFWDKYYSMMAGKLGLDSIGEAERKLISEFEKVLSETGPDMTIFYRLLSELPENFPREKIIDFFSKCFYDAPGPSQEKDFLDLIMSYSKRLAKNNRPVSKSREIMKKANPKFILRNYLLHQAIEELEAGSNELFLKLEAAVLNPYDENSDQFFVRRPQWANDKAGCSMLSCSS
ncbi:MAG TPA: protein adenylyltransferase SelO family protein, partial [Salinimicrobium sp.]|nr:protein adenylyltransferase SelO family protein [Salinimicrobium sp.]